MTTEAEITSAPRPPSDATCAQAAAWIARLHGPERSAKVESGFRLWLAADASHRAAFDMANELWNETERWPKPVVSTFVRREAASAGITPRRWLTMAAGLAAVIITGSYFYLRTPGIASQVGEQRTLTLADGSRVYLNTDTRILVRLDGHSRTVELKNGEALFEVARDPKRTFAVVAGDRKVMALGTSFVVRRDPTQVSVTLLDGKVAVFNFQRKEIKGQGREETTILSPGQRLTLAADKPPQVDEPSMEKITAWQRNQVILDHTSLSEAVKEMNRYSETRLIVASPEAAAAQITGVFRVGDSGSFAQAVADAYRLQVTRAPDEILISGTPMAVHR